MKKILCVIVCLLAFFSYANAINVKGDFTADSRFSLTNGDILFGEVNGNLKFDQQVDDNMYGMASLQFRYYNSPMGSTSYNNNLSSTDLGTLYSLQPLEISLYEAYFTYSDLFVPRFDLKAGKQRIAWGTADKLNPTDILNPNDFSDPFDFGKKIPTLALNGIYHFSFMEGGIQGVFEPYSGIARMNSIMQTQTRKMILDSFYTNLITNVNSVSTNGVSWGSETFTAPPVNVSNFTAAGKIFATLGGVDLSLSLTHRVNDIPTIQSLSSTANVNVNYNATVNMTSTNVGSLDMGSGSYKLTGSSLVTNSITTTNVQTNVTLTSVSYNGGYFQETSVGFDLSKDFGFLLAWAEVSAVYVQEQKTSVKSVNNVSSSGNIILQTAVVAIATNLGGYVVTNYTTNITTNASASTTVTSNYTQTSISNDVYVKYTVGFDKNFEGGWYINCQYNHGFFNEVGNTLSDRLQDYLLIRLEKKFLSDKLKFSLTGIGNVDNMYVALSSSNIGKYIYDNNGELGMFSVSYSPTASVTLETGVVGIDGKGNTQLAAMKGNNLVYTKLEYSF